MNVRKIISLIILALLSIFTIIYVGMNNQYRIECVSRVRDCMCARQRVCSVFELSEAINNNKHVVHKYLLCIFDLLHTTCIPLNTHLLIYDWCCDYMFRIFITQSESKCRYFKQDAERKLLHRLHIRIGVRCTSLVSSQSV